MWTIPWVVAIIAAMSSNGGAGEILQGRLLPGGPLVGDAPILGRATCGTTWLLNEALQLIEIASPSRRVAAHAARGFTSNARPWGLACLADGSLWTLEAPRSLVRLATDGRVVERVNLGPPRVALFSAGDRLLFHQLPTIVSAPVLATSPPGRPFEVRPWSGPIGRAAAAHEDQLARNIVNCGVSAGAFVPCWFIDEPRISISDGATVRSQTFAALRSAAVDQTLPIWDAAVVGSGGMWVLATSVRAFHDRRAGGQLVRVDRSGAERGRVALEPAARLILTATETTCTLLTVRGELMEVVVQ